MKVNELLEMTEEEILKSASEYKPGRLLISKWLDALYFKELEKEYQKSKNKAIILEAVYICSLNDFELPEWLQMAFISGYRKVRNYQAGSWGEVFGRAHPKRIHLGTKRELWLKKYQVYNRVNEIIKTEPSTPIDKNLFERVGLELGVGGSTKISDIYYETKNYLETKTNDIIYQMKKNQIK